METTRTYVAGHTGLVGSALWRLLSERDDTALIGRTHAELDLEDQAEVFRFFAAERPEVVFLAAAKVGGIVANDRYPGDFIRSNLAIQCNVLEAARRWSVRRLLFLGSSCVYPRLAPQPIKEEHLLSSELEPTNRAYAVAKIAGIEMCRSYNRQYGTHFSAVMPTNLYGPGDNFDLETSHVLPAMIRRFHEAKVGGLPVVRLWGTGAPRREFLHVDDMAAACVAVADAPFAAELFNIGFGSDLAIRELAETVRQIVGYSGAVEWDTSRPDGTPRKLLDSTRIFKLGWRPRISLAEGIYETYQWFLANATAPAGA